MKISEVKAILLGMLVFLLILGGWLIYRQITRTDVLKSDEVLIPEDHGVWKRDIFFIEEPTRNFDEYRIIDDNVIMTNLHQESIPAINPKVQEYLNKRNNYIKGFEKKFQINTLQENGKEHIYFLYPFTDQPAIEEILPVTSNGNDRILIIGYDDNLYLLDTNFNLLDQCDYFGYLGKSVISANFTDRIWLQDGDGGSTFTMVIHKISIKNDRLILDDLYRETEYEVEGVFNTFKVINALTNPRLAVYRKGKSDFWFYTFFFLMIFLKSFTRIELDPINFIVMLILILLIFLRYNRQIIAFFHSKREKLLKSRKRG
jgi:hypothetical protein